MPTTAQRITSRMGEKLVKALMTKAAAQMTTQGISLTPFFHILRMASKIRATTQTEIPARAWRT